MPESGVPASGGIDTDAATSASSASTRPLGDEPLDVEILDSSVVYEGRVWDVRNDRFRYGDHELERQYVDHPGASAIVALDDRERVLLIQQYRHPIRHRDWEIPAGLLDMDGESPLETAKRELAEEADLAAEHWEPLVSVFSTPGGNDEVVHIFFATGLQPLDTVHDREAEEADIRIEWVPLADAVTAVLEGRLRNGILAVGVLAAAERLRRTES